MWQPLAANLHVGQPNFRSGADAAGGSLCTATLPSPLADVDLALPLPFPFLPLAPLAFLGPFFLAFLPLPFPFFSAISAFWSARRRCCSRGPMHAGGASREAGASRPPYRGKLSFIKLFLFFGSEVSAYIRHQKNA